jgi:hypothetical protein
MATRSVLVTLPSAEAQELLAELTLDLGLRVRLLHGRMTERETRLALEIDGDPDRVQEGGALRRSESAGCSLLSGIVINTRSV